MKYLEKGEPMTRRKQIPVIIAIITLLTVGYSIYYTQNIVQHNILVSDEKNFQKSVEIESNAANMLLTQEFQRIDRIITILKQVDAVHLPNIFSTVIDTNDYTNGYIVQTDGSYLDDDRTYHRNFKEIELIKTALNQKKTLIEYVPKYSDSEANLYFITPFQQNGNTVALVLCYKKSKVNEQLAGYQFDQRNSAVIVDKQNNVVLGSETPQIASIQMASTNNINEIQYTEDKSVMYMKRSLAYDDWTLITSTTLENSNSWKYLEEAISILFPFLIIILIGFAILLFINYIFSTRYDKFSNTYTPKTFKRKAEKIIKHHSDQRFIIVKLDIKDFKLINRQYDFKTGDLVLRNTAAALEHALHKMNHLITRAGTDDFIILFPYNNHLDLDTLRTTFISRFKQNMGNSFETSIIFPTGQYITTYEDACNINIDEILEKVNFAHRHAKKHDQLHIITYNEKTEQQALFEKSIRDRMENALLNDEFLLYLQPKYDTQQKQICGAEALVRWIDVEGNMIYPDKFLPIFEKDGFITKLDFYMFKKTAELIKKMMDEGKQPYTISVNFSRLHLLQSNFVDELCRIADYYDVPHHYLEIEITENAVFENIDIIKQLLIDLHQADFTLSMDDFGSGYSSLALLKDIEVDVLKIDKEFFNENSNTERSRILIENIFHLANQLQIHTVAEGIETLEQVLMLERFHCDVIQGYYYAKPMPVDQYYKTYFQV